MREVVNGGVGIMKGEALDETRNKTFYLEIRCVMNMSCQVPERKINKVKNKFMTTTYKTQKEMRWK